MMLLLTGADMRHQNCIKLCFPSKIIFLPCQKSGPHIHDIRGDEGGIMICRID